LTYVESSDVLGMVIVIGRYIASVTSNSFEYVLPAYVYVAVILSESFSVLEP